MATSKMFERTFNLATAEAFTSESGKSFSTIWHHGAEGKFATMLKRGKGQYVGCYINQRSEIPIKALEPRPMPHMAERDLMDHAKKNGFDLRAFGTELYRKIHTPEDDDHEVVEGEMVPVEGGNFDRVETSTTVEVSTMVEVSTTIEHSIDRAVNWMDASKRYAQISIICAARAGAEFSNLKYACQRGEWMKVLELLPVGKDTVYKYIKVAEELHARLKKAGDEIDLIRLPEPQLLISGEHDEIVDKINAVTGEQTLRQLYFDWGICKAPGKPGGNHHPDGKKTPKELAEIRRKDATESVGELCTDLQNVCINERRCIERADLDLLKLLEGDLIDALQHVRTIIKAG